MANEVRLIDANALTELEDLEYYYQPVRDGEAWYRVADVWACIDSAPTIDPESLRPKGRWVHAVYNVFACSECLMRDCMSQKKLKNYCPNCGAKMEG